MDKYFQVVWFCFLLSGTLSGQMTADSSFIKIEETLLAQLAVYPQEKIHLHTDRDLYVPGEKIWIKAYIVDAVTHLYPTNSRYIYVELIDNRDSLVGRVMIRPDNDMFYGHLNISENIPEGNYTLRAYTRYMENMGDDYFFKKNIRIGSKGINPLVSRNRGNGDDFDVSFFPEGGNLPEGVLCKVAFKALNRDGYPEQITGCLVDEDGAEIFQGQTYQTHHAGMGVFTYLPEAGKIYRLKFINEHGLEKVFELPQPNPRAYSLAISMQNSNIRIGIQKSRQAPDIQCYLLAHCRGDLLYFSAWDSNKIIQLSLEDFPAGVIQFVLLDSQMNPLSERLTFNHSDATIPIAFHTDKETYRIRDKVISTISLTSSPMGRAGEEESHFSIAITDDKDYAVDATTTILSSILLSSELKGYIENPACYLQDPVAMDLLMMTHGWRRYNIPEAIKEKYELPHIPFQTSQKISGKVQSGLRSLPVPACEVLIMAQGDYFDVTSTDENGIFVIDDFEYPDGTSYTFRAIGSKGSNRVDLVVHEEKFPEPVFAPQSPFVIQKAEAGEKEDISPENTFVAKAEQRVKYDEEMRTIYLSEVEVTAPRIERKNEPRREYWQNLDSIVTIRSEDIEKIFPRLVSDILKTIPGISVSSSNGGVRINSERDLPPLVLIDGVPHYWPETLGLSPGERQDSPYDSPLEAISVVDVESIDVIKGPGASIFGVRGAGGVISITTKRGSTSINRESEETNYAVYTPLGYQKPVEFYSPRYETLEAKYQSIPDYRTTIFWKPDIVMSEDGEATFDFYTSDFPTTYSVVIEGITADGRIVRQIEKITVN